MKSELQSNGTWSATVGQPRSLCCRPAVSFHHLRPKRYYSRKEKFGARFVKIIKSENGCTNIAIFQFCRETYFPSTDLLSATQNNVCAAYSIIKFYNEETTDTKNRGYL